MRSTRFRPLLGGILTVVTVVGASSLASGHTLPPGTVAGQAILGNTAAALTSLPAPLLQGSDAIAVDAAGDQFVADATTNAITVLPQRSGTLFGQTVVANQPATLVAATNLSSPSGLAFAANGALLISNQTGNDITVLSPVATTLFGQSIPAASAVTLRATASLNAPTDLTFDAAGDLFIANTGANTIIVVPARTATVFGQNLTADTATTLNAAAPLTAPQGLTFDTHGDLIIANSGAGVVDVLPSSSGSLYGTTVVANTLSSLTPPSALATPTTVRCDGTGLLVITDTALPSDLTQPAAPSVFALSPTATTLFGVPLDANALTALTPINPWLPTGVAFGPDGSLLVLNQNSDDVLVTSPTDSTLYGQQVVADQPEEEQSLATVVSPTGDAVDASGDIFIADYESGGVVVVPSHSGLIFGHPMQKDVPFRLQFGRTPVYPTGLVFDGSGNLFMTSLNDDGLAVLPSTSGTLFGHSVTANQLSLVSAWPYMTSSFTTTGDFGVAIDASGNLFVTDAGGGGITVLPAVSGPIFGVSATANTPFALPVGDTTVGPAAVTFDSQGNLYYGTSGFVQGSASSALAVLPAASGTLFGQSVTADTPTLLTAAAGIGRIGALAVHGGNLFYSTFIPTPTQVGVITSQPQTIFGQVVPAATATALTAIPSSAAVYGMTFDASGNVIFDDLSTRSEDILVQGINQPPVLMSTAPNGHVALTPVTLTSSGGVTGATRSYVVSGRGCQLHGSRLTATLAGTCRVRAVSFTGTAYLTASSPTIVLHFTKAAAPRLVLTSAPVAGRSASVRLSTHGGIPGRSAHLVVIGTGCHLRGAIVARTAGARCTVQATQAATGTYLATRATALTVVL